MLCDCKTNLKIVASRAVKNGLGFIKKSEKNCTKSKSKWIFEGYFVVKKKTIKFLMIFEKENRFFKIKKKIMK